MKKILIATTYADGNKTLVENGEFPGEWLIVPMSKGENAARGLNGSMVTFTAHAMNSQHFPAFMKTLAPVLAVAAARRRAVSFA